MKSKKTWRKILSLLLTVSIVITTIVPSTAVSAAESSSTEVSISTQNDDNTPQTKIRSDDAETSNADKTDDAQETSKASLEQSQSQQADNDKTDDASTKAATDTNLYQNGSICIYNEQQLKAIGTGTQVYEGDASADTFGTGAVLTDEEGNTLTYAVDGSYTLMNDIPLTKGSIWTLPEGFAGSFQGAEITAEKPLYDAETDTIYVYNNYQLATINDPDAIKTVMSNDMIASEFGVGQVVYTDEEKKTQLEYTADHNYVLSKDFTEQMPEMKAAQVQAESTVQLGGRDYIGQVYKVIDGKGYILIGNQQQLRAIGTDWEVTEPIWKVQQRSVGTSLTEWTVVEGSESLYYPGDADLENGQKLYSNEESDWKKIGNSENRESIWEGGILLPELVGYTQDNYFGSKRINGSQEITYDANATNNINMENISSIGSPIYSVDANYIIFRDIYLTDDGTADGETQEWNPIENFTGIMEGRLNMEEGVNATIHNLEINQDSAIDQSVKGGIIGTLFNTETNTEYGVGFFRDLVTEYDKDLSFNDKVISVSNITLNNVTVKTTTDKIDRTKSLLGGILSGTLKLLGLSGLDEDPKSLATGALAGVVKGNVSITGCKVTNINEISNENDWTGGLVGYSSGITKYDLLSKTAGAIANALAELLNVIPILGLGDVVTILLNGTLGLDQLIPIGYTNAKISDCSVSYVNSKAITGKQYTGGFVGESVGTVISDCNVSTAGTNKVNGTDYVGGFSGKASNAVIVGALNSLGVDLLANTRVNTAMINCDITGNGTINVTASETGDGKGYAGGFVGSMRNSYAVDCDINKLGSVSGYEYVGGFTGEATLGDVADISENKKLLDGVGDLLAGIVSGSTDAQLLSLAGMRPSVITGSQIEGTDITITAEGNYAGGMVGYAGAVQISNTNELKDETKDTAKVLHELLTKNGIIYKYEDVANQLKATNSLNVTGKLNVGGVLGKGTMTSVADVLSSTVKAADYMRFELKDVIVDGGTSGMEVTAVNDSENEDNPQKATNEDQDTDTTKNNIYAGGVIGEGIGGEIQNVIVSNLKTVTGGLGAGGFAGTFGSGTLASVGGVDLLGLGLLEIDGLLSVADMIETFANNSSISGVEGGFSIKATSESGKAGGFIGYCVSGQTTNCSVDKLKEVTANISDGKAGGFIGYAKAGDALASVGDKIENDTLPGGIDIENLLGVISALTPEFDQSTVAFVPNGENPQVEADMAGGFLGDGEAVDINYSINHPSEGESANASTAISGLSNVKGYTYAGGFAGRVQPGDVAQTGSVNLLGLLSVDQLLSVMDVAYPQISNSSITGEDLIVIAEGKTGNVAVGDAGGYIGSGKAVTVENSNISNVKQVSGAYHAGGYIGLMKSGTVAEAGDATGALLNSVLGAVLNVQQLASVLQMASSQIINSKVSGIEAGMTVKAEYRSDNSKANSSAMAGGFVGEMQSGIVNNEANKTGEQKGTAVENLLRVEGLRYAGGFGGLVKSGSVAEIGENTAILNGIVLNDLVSLINSFIPVIQNASVRSVANGFSVHVTGIDTEDDTKDSNAGSAGGFIGYGSGVQISYSDVDKLCNTTVKEPSDLQSTDGTSYFGNESDYSVKGYRNAGGYFGKVNAGSTAAIGGVNIFNKLISLGSLVSALNVTISTIEHSDVYGAVGGFNVIASNSSGNVGKAGGFAGNALGSSIQNCNVDNFAHIIGRESAGGYAGTIEPSSAAELLGDVNVLSGLISADNLVGVLRTFVPIIKNSETTSVPCGGVVRADAESSDAIKRGLAGGYVGYNLGGQIKGNDGEDSTIAKECAAIRIRSVYGTEYAGGYTGLMESANVADTGSISLLYDLIKLDNPLTAVQAIYATEENTAVYGPLTYVDVNDWNGWVTYVGSKGPYADEFAGKTFSSQKELDEFLKDYIYGYEVVSPGADSDKDGMKSNGYAGGYAGKITGAHVTNGQANDLKEVTAWNSAGGFVGVMTPASLASLGDVGIAGLDIVQGLDVLPTFVSVIEKSGVAGYKSGATVQATGYKEGEKAGYAGGFAGNVIGGQIWGETTGEGDSQVSNPCTVKNVCKVTAKNAVGGFAGQILPGSAASVDTSSSNALLNGLLNSVIGTSGDLASVLETTIATIRNVQVTTDNGMGIVVQGAYDNNGTTAYAQSAGGFAGSISGAIIGQKDHPEDGIHINNLQVVNGGEYAGGFAGKADVSAAVEISGQDDTTILGLLAKLGGVDVLDILRPYIYNVDVNGIENYGLEVVANIGKKLTDKNEEAGLYTGNAGGFIGALLCGTVEDSNVTALRSVQGLNYSGGFIGHMGKSGLVDADEVDVLDKLLGFGVGVADVIGSNANRCTVTGVDSGFTVKSSGGESEIVGGFVGYGDLGRMESDTVNKLKQVSSDKIAGGFVGKTSYVYLAEVKVDRELIDLVSKLLNALLKELLQLDEAQAGNVVELDLGIIKVNALWDGKLLSVNLLGIPITASLVEGENQLEVTIGDSSIKLGYKTGNDPTVNVNEDELESTLEVNLIKANRTKVSESSVTGIDIGYDVFGGGATNDKDGNGDQGYAGGFAGFNNEGLLENNKMIKADTIRGTSGKVGEFDGGVSLQSVWTDLKDIEKGNTYQVYRLWDDDQLAVICNTNGNVLATAQDEAENINGIDYYLYTVNHMSAEYHHEDWNSAYQTPKAGSAAQFPVNVYVSAAQADLMLGTPTEENVSDPDKIGQITQDACDTNVTLTIQKLWMDNNNKGNTRPEHVDVQIIKDEGVYKDIDMKSNPSDSNKDSWIWTDTVEIGVLNSTNTGYDHVYQYTVTETPIDGYVTIYGQSEDGYTLYIINYLMSEFVQGDSIVIDYGLPVDVDVLANDRVTENGANGQLVAVGTGTTATTISKELNTGLSNGVTGSYGTAQIQEEDGKKIIEYQPSSMKMDSFDQFTYAVQLNQDVVKNDQNYVYGSLNVIPATEIYYEDNFNMIKYENGTDGTGGDHGTWKTVGTEDSGRHQDTDRPGTAELKNAIDNVYGNDTSYENDSTYSGGSSHVVTVSSANLKTKNGTSPYAYFTFKGTGFDLISLTAGSTGVMRVRLHEGDDIDGKTLKAWTVQTYYGYSYNEEDKKWEVSDNADGSLYQIPVVKGTDLEYGTYTVEIIPSYIASQDKQDKGSYELYLDAVRIYNSADPEGNDYEAIQKVYSQDKEKNSKSIELRDLIIDANKIANTPSEGEDEADDLPMIGGIVFVDGKDSNSSLSIYESYGPKNEVYIEHDQALAFYIEADAIPDTIQLSAKLVRGDSANLSMACAVPGNDSTQTAFHRIDQHVLKSAYDFHYNLNNQCIWEREENGKYRTKYPIVISNTSDKNSNAVISLTNLNWTGAVMTETKEMPIAVNLYVDNQTADIVHELVNTNIK